MRYFFYLPAFFLATAVGAQSLAPLEQFLKNTQSARAEFTQTLTLPAKGAQAPQTKTSSGTFAFIRPHKFKLSYSKPFQQTIVADGKTLWLYDVDLKQVTARAQTKALAATPVALIASASDLKALQNSYNLTAAPEKEGVQWIEAVPKAAEGPLQSIRIGLQGQQLHSLEMLDSFGQRSVMRFTHFEVNPTQWPTGTFEFTPPKGVDVLWQ